MNGLVQGELTEKLALLPERPGVYLMKDSQAKIIYVGKAINLKNRVRSYFQTSRNHSPKVKAMVARIFDLETVIVNTEIEALILECNLIKKHRPHYNISLRDDKSFPYIKVTVNESFPRLLATRRVQKDGARYFGPYTDSGAMHETIRLLRRLFPIRTCRRLDAPRPCLQYHIKRCQAPCAGLVDSSIYSEMIRAVCLFLEGRSDALTRGLRRQMEQAAANLQFEQAAQLRDQLTALEKVTERQAIVTGAGDQDVLGLARSPFGACVQVLFVRAGKMIGQERFLLAGSEHEADEAVLTAFIQQYYSRASFIPRELLLPLCLPEQELLCQWLSQQKEGKVELSVPKRGIKKDLLAMAAGNAAEVLAAQAAKAETEAVRTTGAVAELGRYLGLAQEPVRIECFDISHIQGAQTVASMVVFEQGEPVKRDYRRFKLRTVEGKPDDFRSMEEVVSRRYCDADPAGLPDLVIIDGGKGQLGVALAIIRKAGLTLPVIGLAERFEHIFCEGESEPLILPRHSQALYLVQRVRDEAHRFAVSYHRQLRRKRNLESVLDHVSGIGPKRRKALWAHFGSLAKIKAADVDGLAAAPGMTQAAAEAVYRFFRAGIL